MTGAASMFVPTAGLAALSGLVISCFVNLVAYGAYKRELALQETTFWSWQKTLLVMFIFGNLVGIGLFLYAESFGAVAVAMPSETAVLLLSNLVFQHILGIGKIHGSRLKGTLVLCAATACLKDVGPLEADSESMDVFSRILTPTSIGWILLQLIVGGVCLRMICRTDTKIKRFANMHSEKLLDATSADLTKVPEEASEGAEESHGRFKTTLAYATLVAVATAGGATVGKMISQARGIMLYECYFAYAVCGYLCLYYGAKAAELCDQSQYLPINECIKLALTAVTGLIVWGDEVEYPSVYFMVYMLLCLGASLCAEADNQKSLLNDVEVLCLNDVEALG